MQSFIKWYRLPVSMLAAFLTVCAISSLLAPETDGVIMSNSFYSVICFCCFSSFYYHTWAHTVSRKTKIFACTAGSLFALCIVLGTQMRVDGLIHYTAAAMTRTLLQTAGLSIMTVTLLLAGTHVFPLAGQRLEKAALHPKWLSLSKLLSGRRLFFFSWAVCFLCWLPVFLAYYPGIFSYDVPRQVVQAAEHTYSTHHPLLHTLYLNGAMYLGHTITGTFAPGVALYTLTQMLILSACFAWFCHMTGKKQLPIPFRLLSLLFFALHPVIHLMAVSATKDTLFSGFLLVCVTSLWDLVTDPRPFFRHKGNVCLLTAAAVMMMLFRNNGMYAFLVLIPVLLVVLWPYRKSVLLTVCAALLLYQGANRLLILSCDASPGSIAEMMSIPLQQIARTLLYCPDDITQEERNLFYEIIPEQAAAQYYDHLADLVKSDFNEKAFYDNPGTYIRLWLSLGLRHPGCYLDAFFATTLGYWYPDDTCHAYIYAAQRHGYLMTQHMGEIPNLGETIIVEKHSFLPWLETLYEEMATWNKHQNIPVLSMLFSPGMHCWLLLFTIGLCLCRNDLRPMLAVFALPFGLWLTLLLSPTVLMRYVFPLTLLQPLLLSCWLKGPERTITASDAVSDSQHMAVPNLPG